jgi:hypothetical protein
MTLQSVEVSRTQTNTTDNPSGSREFLVFDDDPSAPAVSLQAAISKTGVKLFKRDKSPVLGRLIPLEVSVSTDLEGPNKFKVSWKYGLDVVTDSTSEPGDPSFVDFSITQRPVPVDTYRDRTADNSGTGSILTDIAGESLDTGGDPLTTFVNQQDLSITVRSESFSDIPVSTSLGLLGKRNKTPFFGASAGFLLYTGLSVQRDGVNSYNTTLTFTFDEFAHRRQVPLKDPDGVLIPKNNGTSGEPDFAAKTVHLKQPFPATAEFSTLNLPNPI